MKNENGTRRGKEVMARERTDKVKNKPSKEKTREKTRAAKSGAALSAGSPALEQTEGPTGQPSLQPAVGSKKRRERIQEGPSADSGASETSLVQEPASFNGHAGIEDESAAMHRRIAERAFLLYQESSGEHGNDWAHWFEAEREIKDTHV
jgi:hypothetical protein